MAGYAGPQDGRPDWRRTAVAGRRDPDRGSQIARFLCCHRTNGTRTLPAPLDWVCLSPKAGAPLVLHEADELKLVYPQDGAGPDGFARFPAQHHWLSPMDGPQLQSNTEAAV